MSQMVIHQSVGVVGTDLNDLMEELDKIVIPKNHVLVLTVYGQQHTFNTQRELQKFTNGLQTMFIMMDDRMLNPKAFSKYVQ